MSIVLHSEICSLFKRKNQFCFDCKGFNTISAEFGSLFQ